MRTRRAAAIWGWLVLAACSADHEIGQYRGVSGSANRGGSAGAAGSAGGSAAFGGGPVGAGGEQPPGSTPGDTVSYGGGSGGVVSGGGIEVGGGAGAPSSPQLIDDFEDGDLMLLETAARSGPWLVAQESWACERPTLEVLAPGASGSLFASVVEFSCPADLDELLRGLFSASWLEDEVWQARPYDASSLAGLTFTAKTSEELGGLALLVVLRVSRPEPCTTPVCVVEYGAAAEVTTDWTRIELPWKSFDRSSGVTGYVPLDPSRLEAVSLRVDEDISARVDSVGPFELWVDDVSFLASLPAANTE